MELQRTTRAKKRLVVRECLTSKYQEPLRKPPTIIASRRPDVQQARVDNPRNAAKVEDVGKLGDDRCGESGSGKGQPASDLLRETQWKEEGAPRRKEHLKTALRSEHTRWPSTTTGRCRGEE